MRHILAKMALVLIPFMVFACAGTKSFEPNPKYNLDDQLERVTEIQRYSMKDWKKVDSQSLILQTGTSNYYLVVLTIPSTELMFSEVITVSSTGAAVKPGFDRVTVYQAREGRDYVIDKIYKLKDWDQAKAITAQLTGKQ